MTPEKLIQIGQRIKDARESKEITQDELAQSLELHRSTIIRYETGKVKNFKRTVIDGIAKELNISSEWLMCESETKKVLMHPIISEDNVTYPVIGDLAAGYGSVALEDWSGETIEIPKSMLNGHNTNEFIVLKIHGDSMYPMYQDKDIVVIRIQDIADNNSIAAIIYGDECATLKKLEFSADNSSLKLVPINPMYQPVTLNKEELNHCHIIGVPLMLIRQF